MSASNQGPVPPSFTFVNGSEDSNLFVKVGGTTTSVTASNGTVFTTLAPQGITYGTASGTLASFTTMDSGGNLVITGDNSVHLFPSGSTNAGAVISSPSVASMSLAAFDDTQTQIVVVADRGFVSITGSGGSGDGVDKTFAGKTIFAKVLTAGILNFQLQGSGLRPGTILEFVMDPTSFAGSQVNVTNGSGGGAITVASLTIPGTAAQASSARIITPDGTNFYKLV